MPVAALLAAFVHADIAGAENACDDTAQPTARCGSVALQATYIGELLRNASGGIQTGNAYLDRFDLVLEIDGERAFDRPGLHVFGHLMYNNGAPFSERYAGDVQYVSNIEGVDSWRLYEFWLDYSFGAEHTHSVLFGLYDLNREFDMLDSAT
ncbi:MAG: hypothetical protein RML32_13630, partial [Gammaproteobacteria bacterium]|nr:hypothetical protein [Gammaproteobacteria bacterium]